MKIRLGLTVNGEPVDLLADDYKTLLEVLREDLGLTPAEFAVLRRLDTPQKIQKFLFSLGQNFELDGDTCRTVRGVPHAWSSFLTT